MNESKLIVLENSSSRFEVGSDGYPRSLIDKQTGKDYLVKDPLIPMMQLSTTSASSLITKCSFSEGKFRAEFGATGVTAVFQVTSYPDYFHWKLIELVNGETVTSIQVFRVFVEIRENRGSVLNIAWNAQFACCALAISKGVNTDLRINLNAGLSLTVYRETGLVGSEWAIIACRRGRVEDVIGQVADTHGLPNPKVNGVRAKDAPFNQRSYFFTDMTEANHDFILKACQEAGIRLILPNIYPQFHDNIGHYNLRPDTYPGGVAGYDAIVKKFKTAGIGVGLHIYLPLIDHLDSYASPTLDEGLIRANAFILAEDMDENTTVIVIERSPIGMMQGGSLLIEDERVDFGWVSWDKPYGFHGARRGCYKTRTARHKAGTVVYLLGTNAGCMQMNLRSHLFTKVCKKVSELVNRLGIDFIFFDAHESPVHLAQTRVATRWCDRPLSTTTIFSMLDRQDIMIEAADTQHYEWHLQTRGTGSDPDPTQPQAENPYYKRRQPQILGYEEQIANLLPPTLGWSLLHGRGQGLRGLWEGVSPTTVHDIEVHIDVARELNCPLYFEVTDEDLRTNKNLPQIFKLIKKFETDRLKQFGL